MSWKYVRFGGVLVYSPLTVFCRAAFGKVITMVARFFVGLIGLVIAMLFMRLLADEARRARVPLRKNEGSRPLKDVRPLRQDPATGVYYPAD
jgi:hypothetical protein